MNVLRILCIYLRLYHYFCCFWTKLSTACWLAVDIAAYPRFLCCGMRFVLDEIRNKLIGVNHHLFIYIILFFKVKMIAVGELLPVRIAAKEVVHYRVKMSAISVIR